MEYRIHPKTGDRIGVIGLGTGPIFEAPEKDALAALTYAHEQGVNYGDFATAGARTLRSPGAAVAPGGGGVREQFPPLPGGGSPLRNAGKGKGKQVGDYRNQGPGIPLQPRHPL